jgi:hypothetical protein
MKTHYSEADLLEMHYLKPCMNTAMLAHVEACSECTAKLQRLEQKLRSVACETPDKPETFWARQRLSIVRRVGDRRSKTRSIARALRIAAAAVLAFFLGGVVVYRAVEPGLEAPLEKHATTATVAASTPNGEDPQLLHDPWQSDELNDFQSVVKWESWIDTKDGGQL